MGRPSDDWNLENLSRSYRHLGCGGVTVVSGDHYVMLESPFQPVTGTFCVGCNNYVPLDKVVWEDTLEVVKTYRQRIYDSVTWKRRWYLVLIGNAYEGALNLRLDSKGRPLPPNDGG
ncbi:MAG: hypothetical protein ACRC1K_14880 [Planctomycetia bacterium]